MINLALSARAVMGAVLATSLASAVPAFAASGHGGGSGGGRNASMPPISGGARIGARSRAEIGFRHGGGEGLHARQQTVRHGFGGRRGGYGYGGAILENVYDGAPFAGPDEAFAVNPYTRLPIRVGIAPSPSAAPLVLVVNGTARSGLSRPRFTGTTGRSAGTGAVGRSFAPRIVAIDVPRG